jgi:hypothetical protein
MAYLSNILNKFTATKFIVGATDSSYTSIQSAIDDAHSLFSSSSKSQIVYIKSGLYTEDLDFKPGVVLVGAHDPTIMNDKRIQDPNDIDFNFGVFIIGAHEIDGTGERGHYNLKNIYFLSKGFGTSGTFASSIINYSDDGSSNGEASKIVIENCKFATGYEPTDTSGPIFNCMETGADRYMYAMVTFNDCSFYCPSPASSGEFVYSYAAFKLLGETNAVYKFNNCEFDATNDAEAQTSIYTSIRLRNLGTNNWLTSFENCKFINFAIEVGEQDNNLTGYNDITLTNCNIPVVNESFFWFAGKCGAVKVENCLVDLGDSGFFISGNSDGYPVDFSSAGTIFKRSNTDVQIDGNVVDGFGLDTWMKNASKVIDSYPPLYAVYSDSTTQTIATINRAYPIQFNTHESTSSNGGMSPYSAGVYIEDDNQATPKPTCISFTAAGVYNIQFSAQLDRNGNGTDTANFFLRKNGETHAANVARSNTTLTVSGNAHAAKIVAAWNFVVAVEQGDYYQLVWSGTSTDLRLLAVAAVAGTAPNYYDKVPATPSIILTVTRIR